EDVVLAVNYARERSLKVAVQGGGHGMGAAVSDLLINTRRMDSVLVDPDTRIATIGAGTRWSDVIVAAAPLGLMPVIGSTSHVGAIGYLLGGGVSPIARSHGFSSDYVESFTMVTAAGEVVETSATVRPDLFWALKGGKSGFGIVTEARVRLVEMTTLYAGVLAFEEDHIETVFRGWLDWTRTAHPNVTTSTAIIAFPDLDFAPPPFRGKRILFLRFAFPGDVELGAELAAPLRALAPVYADMLGEMPASRFDAIHMDPTDPMPAWISGAQLSYTDQVFADRWLARFGAGTESPLVMSELRHSGGTATKEATSPDAVTGRDAQFTVFLAAMYPPLFESIAPGAAGETMRAIREWMLPVANVNLMGENPLVRPWTPETQARLDLVRNHYDPAGVFALRW
ncbi:MAG TPA: FAD-binding oxidoreductase, partial [Thermomicrobiales bacterium]|nr:FAD-binding oxidoreductase [Thermomicrobiales bacterium]